MTVKNFGLSDLKSDISDAVLCAFCDEELLFSLDFVYTC